MTSPSPLESIFFAALEKRTPDERATFLDEACAQDPELRSRVERMLLAQVQVGNFLETPVASLEMAADTRIDAPLSETVGTVIGPYKLLQQIGEGGMGVVFMAEQTEPINRTVALKIIKPGMDSRQVIARFEAERQALAMMDHPNIAKVLDAGTTESGHPYFVMELVRGVPITNYCDDKRLPLRERLRLLVPVCQALQHAHQKGIIHRDLKPTNVLVAEYDNLAVPKIIDFGVAKATVQRLTERTMFTEFGQIVGTIEYMSPEQAKFNQLDIDTRSDIYSLGVLLYELLAGSTPIERTRLKELAFDEMLRIVREEEPPRPSTRLSTTAHLPGIAARRGSDLKKLIGLVVGELDWIVMKALEKDCDRRYATANSLALDLENYLAGEPVEACPPSTAYRFRKFASRNKVVLLALGVIALSLVAGTVVSVWQATLARHAESLAQQRLESEQAARARATGEAEKAKAISELLQSMLASANPAAAKGSDYTVRQMLDDFSANFGNQLRDQPEAEAAVHETVANAYRGLHSFDKAEPHFLSALALRRQLFGPAHAEVAQSLIDFSANDYGRGDVTAAEARAREALAIHQKQPLDNNSAMRVLSALQFYLVALSKYEEANQVAQEALEIARRDPNKYPEEATVLHNLAHAATHQGNHVKAEEIARQSLKLHEKIHGNDHPDTAHARYVLATSLREQQKLDEAEVQYREALRVHRKQFDDSQTPVLAALAALAQVLRAKGDQLGLDALRTTIALESSEPKAWEGWHFRGSFFAAIGDWEKADAAFTQAAMLETDPSLSRYLYYLALIRMARNDQAGYRDACAALVKQAGKSADSNSPYMTTWACVLGPDALGDPNKVVAMVERAGEGNSKEPRYLATLGSALYRADRCEEAKTRFDEAIETTTRGTKDERLVTYAQLYLAMIHQHLGEAEAAQQLRNQAVQAIDQLMLPTPANYAETWDSLLPLQLLRSEVDRALLTTKELSNNAN